MKRTYLIFALTGLTLFVGLLVVGVVVLAAKLPRDPVAQKDGDDGQPRPVGDKKAEPQPYRPGKVYRAGDVIAVGDLEVNFVRACDAVIDGERVNLVERKPVSLQALRVDFILENTSAVKVIDWGAWQGHAKVEDEHGNVFQVLEQAAAVAEGLGDPRQADHLLCAVGQAAVEAEEVVGGVTVPAAGGAREVGAEQADGADGGQELAGACPFVAAGGVSAGTGACRGDFSITGDQD